jgi:hypothetical protein
MTPTWPAYDLVSEGWHPRYLTMSTEVVQGRQSAEIAAAPAAPAPASIDRATPIPYYYQLEGLLRQEIRSGRWAPGEPILSEKQLGVRYGVSRTTVRQAVARLVQDGLLYHVKGKGTFVARRPA